MLASLPEIISHALQLFHRFCRNPRDVEALKYE